MKKLIHFGPPLDNHSHTISLDIKGTFLAALGLSAKLILAAVILPLAWLLKIQICIGVKPMMTWEEQKKIILAWKPPEEKP